MLAGALALSACGRLKDDSTRKDPKLAPAPDRAPAVDTAPAPADHAVAPAGPSTPAVRTPKPEPMLSADTGSMPDTPAPADRPVPADTSATDHPLPSDTAVRRSAPP